MFPHVRVLCPGVRPECEWPYNLLQEGVTVLNGFPRVRDDPAVLWQAMSCYGGMVKILWGTLRLAGLGSR
jgi:hypothetical protein